MILVHRCKNCRKETRVKETAYDRFELYRVLKSKRIETITCRKCDLNQTLEINNVFALENIPLKLSICFFLIVATILASIYAYNYLKEDIFGVFVVLIVSLPAPTTLYLNRTVEHRNNVRFFNSNKL